MKSVRHLHQNGCPDKSKISIISIKNSKKNVTIYVEVG